MMKIRLIRDRKSGLLTASLRPENKLLAAFFETEIQDDRKLIEHLLDRIHSSVGELEITGNAFTLALSRDQYRLTSLFDDDEPAVTGPAEEFLELLHRWRVRLERDAKS